MAVVAAVVARERGAVAGKHTLELYSHNVDAMLIAETTNLPTINGFSTFDPPDWNFDDPTRSDYSARVAEYARKHGIDGLRGLNLADLTWNVDIAPRR